MRKIVLVLLFVCCTVPRAAAADGWSVGLSTGPFVFGTFAERSSTIATESGSTTTRSRLSAATRPGASADIERDFNDWLALRLDASWTRAPMKVKSGSGSGVSFNADHVNITTLALPFVLKLNRHGPFRLHPSGGPAYG